ncbi:WD40/YVTN/BNR-like repeat-containing protein [Amphritea sp.]|uniref:WD40/YVTN/BNR-like repeat-containing protein n=1 Tax=Amphritea sp. TaxID=1872502 RepID=UPI003D107553
MVVFSNSILRNRLAGGCLLLLMAGQSWTAVAAADTGFSALDTPAQISAQSVHKTILSVARAGQRLVAVGEEGIILLSDDNGQHWNQIVSPVSAALTEVQFVDPLHGWIVGHYGVVLATTDGGETWQKQLDGIQAAQLLLADVQLRGGDERELREARRLIDDGPDKPFLNLHFTDARNGFVFGAYNLIYRTHDGGQSWQPWLSRVDNPMGLHLYGMAEADGVLMMAGEQGTLLRSTDAGEHFEALDSPYDGSFFGIIAEPDGTFVVYGLRGHLFRSVDNGDSWTQLDTREEVALSAASMLADGRLLVVSQSGSLLVNRNDSGFAPVADLPALPLAGVVQSADGAAIVASLAGVHRFDLPGRIARDSASGSVKE